MRSAITTLTAILLLTSALFSQTNKQTTAVPTPPKLVTKSVKKKNTGAKPKMKAVTKKKATTRTSNTTAGNRKAKAANKKTDKKKSRKSDSSTKSSSKSKKTDLKSSATVLLKNESESTDGPKKLTSESSLVDGSSSKTEEIGTDATPAAELTKEAPPMKAGERIPFMSQKPTTQSAPEIKEEGSLWIKLLGSVALVLGLLFVGAWIIKKTGILGDFDSTQAEHAELKLVTAISPKSGQTISVIKFNDQTLLVGSTANSFTVLAKEKSPLKHVEVASNKSYPRPVPVSELLEQDLEFEGAMQLANTKRANLNLAGGV